jgi:hypothetical protein
MCGFPIKSRPEKGPRLANLGWEMGNGKENGKKPIIIMNKDGSGLESGVARPFSTTFKKEQYIYYSSQIDICVLRNNSYK